MTIHFLLDTFFRYGGIAGFVRGLPDCPLPHEHRARRQRRGGRRAKATRRRRQAQSTTARKNKQLGRQGVNQ
eukprot:scaffold307_cov146-Skeletonema_menzelii.AAC.15